MRSMINAAAAALAMGLGAGAAQAEPFQGLHIGLEAASESYDPTPDGEAVYAAFAGWDTRVGSVWVVGGGVRYTIDGASASATETTPAGFLQTASVSIEDQWAITGRIGRVFGERVLVFAEGGFERFDVDAVRTVRAAVCAPPNGCVVTRNDFSFEETLPTIGAGVEWAASEHVRLRGAYAYGDSDALERNRFSLAVAYAF
ncbi:MAG: outer membrane beta-barrel protein [Hyphomonadaceae bacterium]|nr:outer membrane beta-barrel protein [Hyphomonadaceae bacterium]